ncbi:MAG: YbjQ family protein [Brevundimonas sp.]|uniref:YbjQ family protein n=1 Tax=Brevundimonas sp. TaxID=1871086 RepID=UPI00272298DA|nr:YbjQ family protein [Brevundimonas sp.]MDO9076015.1 YbjQ family protein [Brevundimonas sp.]MDP3079855.1 YbjQ family protein [Brevundimonas sp.]MDZ4061035.1 YbjQ family protein [Brevundimonas sp.]
MLIVTTNDAPGYRIVKTLGLARGITVRSRNLISDAIGGLQSMLGGRVGAYVKLAEASRAEALEHLIEQATGMGANAVIAMRYEANEIMEGVTEVLAYGTAVVVEEA